MTLPAGQLSFPEVVGGTTRRKPLPIYPGYGPTLTAVEAEEALDRDRLPRAGKGDGRACTRCKLRSDNLRSPCISDFGEPGGLLIVGDAPSLEDDSVGKPFSGRNSYLLHRAITEHWNGPVAYASAVRCAPGKKKVTDKHVAKCRPFLAQTLAEAKPSRVIVFGGWAAMGLFGRKVSPLSTRGGYSFLQNPGGEPIPVFFVTPPGQAMRNHFVRKWFEADIKHALTAPDPDPVPAWTGDARVVESKKIARQAERELMAQDWVSFDVETTGTMWNADFEIISVALCGSDPDNNDAWVWDREALEDPRTRAVLLRILESDLPKVGQNVKYDQLAFRAKYKIHVRPILHDTRLQRKLIDPEASGKLGQMAELVGMGGLKEEAEGVMSRIKKDVNRALRAINKPTPSNPAKSVARGNAIFDKLRLPKEVEVALRMGAPIESLMYGLLPYKTLTRYNARDSVATKLLAHYLIGEIKKEPRFWRLWRRQIRPASMALERVEGWGVAANKRAIAAFDKYLEMREGPLKKVLDAYAPDVNWNSPPQVADLFFKKMKFPIVKLTKKNAPSTDGETLELLAKQVDHPLPKAFLDYRFVTKLRGTYAQGLYPHIRADGRIHPNIKLDGARSGRTSATDPNLQNLPRADDDEGYGKMARDCFIAPDGYYLLEVDYSQIELRVAAMLSGDEVMLEIFKSGVDFHLRTAQLISRIAWGIPPEKVEDKHRSLAKSVNFGVIYGKTASTFAREWGVSKAKAQKIVDAIMGQFKKLQKWRQAREREAAQTSFVWTWWDGEFARRRPLFRIADDSDSASASKARNGASNSPIQGTASDFCIASLTQCVQWIEGTGIEEFVKLVLAVHDSLMFEVHESMVDETIETTRHIMLSHNSMNVPLAVDYKIGKQWGSMVKIKPGEKFSQKLLEKRLKEDAEKREKAKRERLAQAMKKKRAA